MIGITSGPWGNKGVVIFKVATYETLAVCKTSADAEAIVELRNSYEELEEENEDLREEIRTGVDPDDYEALEAAYKELKLENEELKEDAKISSPYVVSMEEKCATLEKELKGIKSREYKNDRT